MAATVLVADDDADILRFVEINLRLEGFEVVTARDGRDALGVVCGCNVLRLWARRKNAN